MPIEKLRPTFTFTEDRLAQLCAAVPEAFADGKLNWETLRAALGDFIEEEDADAEHFGLFWPGKRAARRLAMTPGAGTLAPQPGLGVHEETTRNVFIEGDNLEVLKLLLKSYAGRVKLIYIDPPYNTGNDFIYPDDYAEPLDAYLRRTGQMDEEGQLLTTNTKASGRFHSNWLNMIYPRLLLARQLLREDGAIFVSIDDNEVHNLRQVMNEVFVEENFLATLVWKRRTGSNDARNFVSTDHEYIVLYAKSELVSLRGVLKDFSNYSNPDNDPRGPWARDNLTCNKNAQERPNLSYPITDPATGITYQANPNRVWAYERNRMERLIAENKVIFPPDGKGTPQYKRHLSEVRSERKPFSSWVESTTRNLSEIAQEQYEDGVSILQVPLNAQGTRELRDLFETPVFNYPKPSTLISELLHQATDSDQQDVVLDFFSGSGTTAHAVLGLNQEDGGNRRFIMVQLPEPTNDPDYPTIADIGRERIRRVIARMEKDDGRRTTDDGRPMTEDGQLHLDAGQPSPVGGRETTDDERRAPGDLGFKSYRLTRSAFKPWQPYTGEDAAELETLFTRYESPLVEGWQPADLLTEILLLQGFPLDSHVHPLPAFTENHVLRVASEACTHDLLVCLDARLHPATVAALDLRAADVLVCLDSALTDEDKLRLADKGQVRVI